jgi:beta-glucosidase
MLNINIEDVISVLNTLSVHLIVLGVALVAAIVITIACKKANKPLKKLIRKETWIAFLLIAVVIINMICFGPMSSMISLAMGNGSISDETSEEAKALCQAIAEEGIVLMKNDNNTLPLASGTKLNVFGWSSTNPVYGGTGSGSLSDAFPTTSLLEGLTDAGFEVNQDLVDFYTNFRDTRPTVGMMGQDWTIPEPTIDEYNEAGIFESAKEYSDVALVVLSRCGGEGADLPKTYDGEDTFSESGSMFGASGVRYSEYADDLDASKHYLELSNRETAMLEQVTSDYDNVIVIINSANAMELGFVNEYSSISSVIYCPGTGQTGFEGLGEIIAGTVNPSGKTVDTFVSDLTAAPNYNNIGSFTYDNMDDYSVENMFAEGGYASPSFVDYVEGIYVGYRFYETAAEEGLINYDDAVVYPFGYGLSYTTFTQEMGTISENDGTISFDVTVTNTGSVAGKDVVEVYYNPPYTNGGIEKASVNLIAFQKTGTIEPGASETVTVSFAAEDMSSYDSVEAGGYVLEAGDYEISIRTDSHNVIDSQTYTVASASSGKSTDVTQATNKFDDVAGEVTYLSRADGFANYAEATAAPATYSMTDEQKATFMNNDTYNPEDYDNDSDEMPTTGANNGLTLADLRGVDYDDAQWDDLLDQLTVDDMKELIAMGGYETTAASSVGKVMTVDCDGPASINNNFTGQGSIGFPAAVMIASTWNTDLALQFGESIGKMADEMDVSGWYAPAMNIHRSAFAGRNFEYYSEDGLLSGKMAAQAIIGAEEYGVYAYMKHFALNDQETNRCNMICTWANEQSIREIYLKPFEISVKEGGAKAVMSSFNYIGTTPAGSSYALQTEVLRNEWGFQGFVLTDYFGGYGYQDADRMIRGGTDCMLATYDNGLNYLHDTSATSIIAARQSCKNILYTTVNSRAYATDVDGGLMNWQIAAIVIDVILGILIILLAVLAFRKYQKDAAAEPVVRVGDTAHDK